MNDPSMVKDASLASYNLATQTNQVRELLLLSMVYIFTFKLFISRRMLKRSRLLPYKSAEEKSNADAGAKLERIKNETAR